eukprot:5929034-Lingulodinium_polyedra.AAC.1
MVLGALEKGVFVGRCKRATEPTTREETPGLQRELRGGGCVAHSTGRQLNTRMPSRPHCAF